MKRKSGKLPTARYQCMACKFEWQGYRVMWHECTTMGPNPCPDPCPKKGRLEGPPMEGYGMTDCPNSPEHIYVDWLNWKECVEAAREQEKNQRI